MAQELLEHGYALVCPVRDPQSNRARALTALSQSIQSASLSLVHCDLADREATLRALGTQRVDAICSCIASRRGGAQDSELVEYVANSNLLEWGMDLGIRQFSLLSAICVQKPRLAFQRAKLRFEESLIASGLTHSIVRPTAFFKSLSGQLNRVRGGKPFLVFGDGTLTRCKPIAEADLAHYIRLTLEDDALQGVLPVGGPGPAIAPLDQAHMLATLTNQPLRIRSVSPALLRGIATVLDIPGKVFTAMADKAEFARIGHYYATESMLLWDPHNARYDDKATPEFGSVTLKESYVAQLAGDESQQLGEQAVF